MDLLAIDQGNTRTKFGLFRDGELMNHWSVATDKCATSEVLAAVCAQTGASFSTVALCSVTPEVLPAWRAMATLLKTELFEINGRTPTPLRNDYVTPETLGPDRLMAAVAAAQAGTPVIVASLGTATVVDAVSADGAFLGGMIAPGIGTSIESLALKASNLRAPEWEEPSSPIGKTSVESMTAGWFYQTIGGLRAMTRAMRDVLGCDAPLCLTGGWAEKCAPYLDGVSLSDVHLVLRGIAITVAWH